MKELIKLVNENPDLEVVPLVYTDDIEEGFSFTKGQILRCEIDEIYEYDGRIFVWSEDDGLDLLEYIWDETELSSSLAHKEESDAEIEKRARTRYEAVEWKKVIILWIGAE
ncbi:hypothetical protein ACRW9N_02405 [Listeria aquatica]|uniref:hypothetical protein n=1 Tax=Listeria aquatica TaxID=1494960 RepID=UPI003EF79B74